MMTLGQTVQTPNGKGIYQFPMWEEGERLAIVSHPVTAEIDLEKVRGYKYSGGIWKLCAYAESEVTE